MLQALEYTTYIQKLIIIIVHTLWIALNSKPNMYDASYGWPQRHGKRLENRCTTNDDQHAELRNLFLMFSFYHRRMRKNDLKIILSSPSSWLNLITTKVRKDLSPFIVARSNHNESEKRLEKIIPWWWHHLLLDVTIREEKTSCRHFDEFSDAIVEWSPSSSTEPPYIEKTVTSYPSRVVAREEEINPQCQKNGMRF